MEKLAETQLPAIGQAADLIAERVAGGGIIFTFGTGHSHELAEEVAYRAGGVVPVCPILEPSLTGSTEVSKSEFLERLDGFRPSHSRLPPRRQARRIGHYFQLGPQRRAGGNGHGGPRARDLR